MLYYKNELTNHPFYIGHLKCIVNLSVTVRKFTYTQVLKVIIYIHSSSVNQGYITVEWVGVGRKS